MAREKMLHDEAAQNKRRKAERRDREMAKADLKEIMTTPTGRRFMYALLFDRLGLMDVYIPADSGIYRHEGARQKASDLAIELQTEHTEAYILMFSERLREKKYDQSAAPTEDQGDDSNA